MRSNDIDPSILLDLYRAMVRARFFEERAYDLFMEGMVQGTTHLALGQEAIAAGFSTAMDEGDMTFCTYRGHTHTLLRGSPMAGLLGELAGRGIGVCGGKGGSMHLTDIAHKAMGSYAIVGAHLPIAVGAAWASALRGDGQVSVCFFGDGTTNIGAFHEALNLAAVWKLPVVFVCENNLYMEYTPISDVIPVKHPAADRASSYGLDSIIIDGNDVEEVYLTATRTIEQARTGHGPFLVEAKTYRQKGHSRADPGKYRPDEEVAFWLERDPITLFRERLASMGVGASVRDAIDSEALAEVANATEIVQKASPPGPGTLETDVWADGGSRWRN